MPKRNILQFLFENSFTEAETDLDEVIEAMDDVADLSINKKPLDQALAKIGLKPDGVDCEGVRVVFDNSEDYFDAHGKLQSAEVMAQLAELGWVPVFSGDSPAEFTDPERYVIHFIAIDEAPGPDAHQLEQGAAKREIEKTFGRFQGPAAPDKTEAAEESEIKQAVGRLLGEADDMPLEDAPADEREGIDQDFSDLVNPPENRGAESTAAPDIAELWADDQDGEFIKIDDDGSVHHIAHGVAVKEIAPAGTEDAFERIREWSDTQGLYLNIWQVNDHGNVELYGPDGESLGGLV